MKALWVKEGRRTGTVFAYKRHAPRLLSEEKRRLYPNAKIAWRFY
jgi:hypothetical protein